MNKGNDTIFRRVPTLLIRLKINEKQFFFNVRICKISVTFRSFNRFTVILIFVYVFPILESCQIHQRRPKS